MYEMLINLSITINSVSNNVPSVAVYVQILNSLNVEILWRGSYTIYFLQSRRWLRKFCDTLL
jgi:hypothetical protein